MRDELGEIIFTIAIAIMIWLMIAFIPPTELPGEMINSITEPTEIAIAAETVLEECETETGTETKTESETETSYTEQDIYDDLELLAYCVMSEAGNQPEEGKRLVIDTVLNRVDNQYFPDTVRGVIYAPGQFAVVANGSLYKREPTEDIYTLISEEITQRTNDKVIYFTAGGYNPSGEPWAKVGDHYFSYIAKRYQ